MDKQPQYTELDSRHSDGHTVQLLWDADTNETSIRIEEERPPRVIQFQVLGSKAMEAFNHPYAFAPDS